VLLHNASSVGKAAGVSAPDLVPAYLARLARLGVVDIGDEVPALAEQYDILLTEQSVRAAEETAKRAKRGTAKIVRRSVVISALGTEFWARCDPTVDGRPRPAIESSPHQ
jgi:hypothetical protein